MSESKNEAFHRISANRLEKIEKAIGTLGNLSSNNYDSSTEERMQLIEALLSYTKNLCDTFELDFPISNVSSQSDDTTSEICKHCGENCSHHLNRICDDFLQENANEIFDIDEQPIKSKKTKEQSSNQPSVLKVVRDLEFGEMPLFASVLQEALLNFANKKVGSDSHLRQILRISAISLSNRDTE